MLLFFLPSHTIAAGYNGLPSGVCLSVRTLFPDNSSNSLHRVALKLGGQLAHWVSPLFEVTVHQILVDITLFNIFSDLTLFPDNSSYSFHWITLKLGGCLNHEVEQRVLFRGYSTLNFDTVITLVQRFFRTCLCFWITPPTVLQHNGMASRFTIYCIN